MVLLTLSGCLAFPFAGSPACDGLYGRAYWNDGPAFGADLVRSLAGPGQLAAFENGYHDSWDHAPFVSILREVTWVWQGPDKAFVSLVWRNATTATLSLRVWETMSRSQVEPYAQEFADTMIGGAHGRDAANRLLARFVPVRMKGNVAFNTTTSIDLDGPFQWARGIDRANQTKEWYARYDYDREDFTIPAGRGHGTLSVTVDANGFVQVSGTFLGQDNFTFAIRTAWLDHGFQAPPMKQVQYGSWNPNPMTPATTAQCNTEKAELARPPQQPPAEGGGPSERNR